MKGRKRRRRRNVVCICYCYFTLPNVAKAGHFLKQMCILCKYIEIQLKSKSHLKAGNPVLKRSALGRNNAAVGRQYSGTQLMDFLSRPAVTVPLNFIIIWIWKLSSWFATTGGGLVYFFNFPHFGTNVSDGDLFHRRCDHWYVCPLLYFLKRAASVFQTTVCTSVSYAVCNDFLHHPMIKNSAWDKLSNCRRSLQSPNFVAKAKVLRATKLMECDSIRDNLSLKCDNSDL